MPGDPFRAHMDAQWKREHPETAEERMHKTEALRRQDWDAAHGGPPRGYTITTPQTLTADGRWVDYPNAELN